MSSARCAASVMGCFNCQMPLGQAHAVGCPRAMKYGDRVCPVDVKSEPVKDPMTPQQLAVLNALVTYAAENVPGELAPDEREVAKIVGRWALQGRIT